MAKRGKAKRAAKRAAPKRSKAKAAAPKRRAAKGAKATWWGPFTRYVHHVTSSPAIVAHFKANRESHITAFESTNTVKFTVKQKNALITGNITAINAEISAESSSPMPMAMHGGPVLFTSSPWPQAMHGAQAMHGGASSSGTGGTSTS